MKYREKTRVLTIYHRWDIANEDEIVGTEATKADIGKYFEFNDGSGWFSKVIGATPLAIRTEICIVRVDDYVHQSRVQFPQTSYSGAYKTEEHELVRPFNKPEKRCVYRLTHGQEIKYLTKRIKKMTVEKMAEAAKTLGVNEEKIIKLLLGAAEKGNEKVNAIDRLARIGGTELGRRQDKLPTGGLFVQQNLTIQGQRRNPQNQIEDLPSGSELKKLIREAQTKLGDAIEDAKFEREL